MNDEARLRRMVKDGELAEEDTRTASLSPEVILVMAGAKEKDFKKWNLKFPVVE